MKTGFLGLIFITVYYLSISIFTNHHGRNSLTNGRELLWSLPEEERSTKLNYEGNTPKYRFNCDNIGNIKIIKRDVGGGRSKVVDIGLVDGHKVVIKKLSLRKKPHISTDYRDLLFLKEILMRDQLDHPAIIKMMGYCVRYLKSEEFRQHPRSGGITAVYEYGEEFNVTRLKLNTTERLNHALWLAYLLSYLQHSQVGPLILGDFNAESHFLMVNGSIKLIDLDYVHGAEPPCLLERNGTVVDPCDYDVPCQSVNNYLIDYASCYGRKSCYVGVCNGLNELYNIRVIYKAFFIHLLKPEYFPILIQADVRSFLRGVKKHTFKSDMIVNELKRLIIKNNLIG